MEVSRRRISYFYEDTIGNYYYGSGHPMKPNRVRMANRLIEEFGLYSKLDIFQSYALSASEMVKFHDENYIDFLENVTVDNQEDYKLQFSEFLGKSKNTDCPVFDGMFEFCQLYSGGSVCGASKLNHRESDVVINWAGGFHHAKKSQAAGFCYVNDIVLAIMELLKFHGRVMYIDIDVHHGDGVEEAFYCTDRVLTVSFHKGGNFFPGTGDVEDIGIENGMYHALNFPLHAGTNDDTFFAAFKPVVDAAVARFRPEAVVLQCGADSLTGDRLGCFNLTCIGHGRCVEHVCAFGLPTLVLGGGGYTVRNVARCWTYETSVCLKEELPNLIPPHEFTDCYAPDYRLHLPPSMAKDSNSRKYIDEKTALLLETIKRIPIAPSQSGSKEKGAKKGDDEAKVLPKRNVSSPETITLNTAAESLGEFFERSNG